MPTTLLIYVTDKRGRRQKDIGNMCDINVLNYVYKQPYRQRDNLTLEEISSLTKKKVGPFGT